MKNIRWSIAIPIVLAAVYLIDLNLIWYRHPANKIPVLKYSIIGLSVILFTAVVYFFIRNRSSKNKPNDFHHKK